MRYPVASIRLDCGVNRISVSHDKHVLAVPLDNRHIRLYDLGGNRIANLPHRNRKVTLCVHTHIICTGTTFGVIYGNTMTNRFVHVVWVVLNYRR